MNYLLHNTPSTPIVEIDTNKVFNTAQDFLEMMMNVPEDTIIIHQKNLSESFFDLKSGLAGEILQKVVNYRMKLAIVGDFSVYSSKSLRDFIYESNKSGVIIFTSDIGDAIAKFSNRV